MQAERDFLVRFVFPRLREELFARRIHLVDVDLRWGVTGDQDASEVCRDVITDCRPHFVCILGGRYGTIPDGKVISITADEIRFAVLDANRVGVNALFFFRDGTVTEAMDRVSPGLIREPRQSPKAKALAQLKREIRGVGLRIERYHPRWDASERRLLGLNPFGERVARGILEAIDAEFGTQIPEPPDEFEEEDAAMEAFAEERGERFVLGGRRAVLEKLLAHATATNDANYLCLTGEPGSGKSAMLAHLSRQAIINDSARALLIRHFVGASPGSTDVRRTLRRLCRALKRGSPDITTPIPDDSNLLQVAFPEILRQASERRRVVILLDAIDHLSPISPQAGPHWLPNAAPANVRVILSMLDGPELDRFRRRQGQLLEVKLRPLGVHDRRAILEQFSERSRKRLEPNQRKGLLSKRGSGAPLYLLAALEELRTLGTHEEITRRIAELPATTLDLFAWILKRLEADDVFRDAAGRRVGPDLVPGFATLLVASRHGLSERELSDLLHPGDPLGNVAALLRLLRPYLMRRGELLDFYHGQFREAARRSWAATDAQRRAAHVRLARYFQGRRHDSRGRASSELPYHLASAGLEEELLALTGDVEYLEDALACHGIGDTLAHLGRAGEALAPGSGARSRFARLLEILAGEAGSLRHWRRERPFPNIFDQLALGSARRGHVGLFREMTPPDSGGIVGSIALGWALGGAAVDLKERMTMPGVRENYSWDSYGYGPMGRWSRLWVDLARRRLLTDSVSRYGSFETCDSRCTHHPMEWDLETGLLLVEHGQQHDDWNVERALPRAFEGLDALTSMRKPTTDASRLKARIPLMEGEEFIDLTAIGRSVNSEEEVFSLSVRMSPWSLEQRISILCAYDQKAGRLYRTSHAPAGMTVEAIIRTDRGLTAFATDHVGDVYRLLLEESTASQPPVLEVAIGEGSGEYACVRPTGIEVRAVLSNELLRVHAFEDMHGPDGSHRDVTTAYYEESAPEGFRWTPDGRWLLQGRPGGASGIKVLARESGIGLLDGMFSAVGDQTVRRRWPDEEINDISRHANDQGRNVVCTRLGKFRLVKRRCTIDAWEVASGRLLGTVGNGPRYGGGGSMHGIATHPDERFFISSDDEQGSIMVWDLEDGLKSWRLNGIGPLGLVRSLAFLWGGHLVAALTEDHFLYFLRFWCQSEIVGAVRVNQGIKFIRGAPYGNSLLVLFESGRLGCYEYGPRPRGDVTTARDHVLHVRCRYPGANSVHIAGSFNGWDPSATPLATEDGRLWQRSLTLERGRTEYRLVIDGARWEIDLHRPFVPGPFGPNSYVDLPAPARGREGPTAQDGPA